MTTTVQLQSQQGPRVGYTTIQGKTVRVEVHRFPASYRGQLLAYLRRYGWPRRHLLGALGRGYQDDGDGHLSEPLIAFLDARALADDELGAHEAGHVLDRRHAPWYKWTTMHPWGILRLRDPEGLVPIWREARERISWEANPA